MAKPIPPIIDDMLRKLNDKLVSDYERDNIASVVEEIVRRGAGSLATHEKLKTQANEEARRVARSARTAKKKAATRGGSSTSSLDTSR